MGIAEVYATAAHTAVGRIGTDLAATVEPPSALQQGSRRLVRTLGAAAVVLALAQVLLSWWWNGRPLLDSLLSGIALAWRAWRFAQADAREHARPAMWAVVVTFFPLNTHLAFYSAFWGGIALLLVALYAGSLLAKDELAE